MALVCLQMVKFQSIQLDPDEDILISWLTELGFWDPEVESRVAEAQNYLPLDVETDFRNIFHLPLLNPTKKLVHKLLSSDIGLSLKTLGFEGCECEEWKDTETCTGKVLSLKLARVQDRKKLKALKIAFDPRAQFLIGLRAVPYS